MISIPGINPDGRPNATFDSFWAFAGNDFAGLLTDDGYVFLRPTFMGEIDLRTCPKCGKPMKEHHCPTNNILHFENLLNPTGSDTRS